MKYLIITLSIVFAFACSPSTEKKEEDKKEEKISLKDKVMEIHDEIMPKMGELRRARKEIEEKMKDADQALKGEYQEVAKKIEEANESMMIWMRNFNPNPEGTEEEIEAYLEEQMKSIQKVKDDMLTSLEKAKEKSK